MKRRLTLALAFAGSPTVLLLDEPSSGCDSWTRELVRKDILLRRESTAVLVSTHHIDDVEVLSDSVWFLNERFLAFNGTLDELTELESSNSTYNTNIPCTDTNNNAENCEMKSDTREVSEDRNKHNSPFSDRTDKTNHDSKTETGVINEEEVSQNYLQHPTQHHTQHPTQDFYMKLDIQFSTWSQTVMKTFTEEFSAKTADTWLVER